MPVSSYLDSESHFRRYENYLKEITLSWPKPIIFTPQPPVASVETLSTRIRICIKSLRNNQWPISWDYGKFIRICDEIIVSTKANPGKVTCGPYDQIRKVVPLGTSVEDESASADIPSLSSIKLTNPPTDLLLAVLVLHHYQLIIEPSLITGDDLTHLAKSYDVAISYENGVNTII